MLHFEQEEFTFPLGEEENVRKKGEENMKERIKENDSKETEKVSDEKGVFEFYDKDMKDWNEDRKKIQEMLAEEHMKKIFVDRERFSEEKKKTKQAFENFLERSFDESFSEKFLRFFEGETGEWDLELLTLIRLYGDSYQPEHKGELFEHSLGVLKIAAEAYPQVLVSEINGGRIFYDVYGKIREEMCIRGDGAGGEEKSFEMAFREFLRACILHDVGKISLPEFVVYNAVTNEQSRGEIRNIPIEEAGDLFVRFQNAQWFPVSMRKESEKSEFKISMKREVQREKKEEKFSPKDEERKRKEELIRKQRENLLLETFFSDVDERRRFKNGEECLFSDEKRNRICDWLDRKDVDARVNILMPVGMLVDFDVDLNFGNKPKEEKKNVGFDANTNLEDTSEEEIKQRKTFERARRRKELSTLGIAPDTSFMKVLDQHEQRSGSLLETIEKDPILKVLALYHHNKAHKIVRFFDSDLSNAQSLDQLEAYFKEYGVYVDTKDHPIADVSLSFIHLCDVFDALRSERSYKKPFPLDRALFTLIKDAKGMLEKGGKPDLNLQTTAFFIEFQIRKEYERKLMQEQHLSAKEANANSLSQEYTELMNTLDMNPELKEYIQDFLDKQSE